MLDESHSSITHGCRQPSNQAHKTIRRRELTAAKLKYTDPDSQLGRDRYTNYRPTLACATDSNGDGPFGIKSSRGSNPYSFPTDPG